MNPEQSQVRRRDLLKGSLVASASMLTDFGYSAEDQSGRNRDLLAKENQNEGRWTGN